MAICMRDCFIGIMEKFTSRLFSIFSPRVLVSLQGPLIWGAKTCRDQSMLVWWGCQWLRSAVSFYVVANFAPECCRQPTGHSESLHGESTYCGSGPLTITFKRLSTMYLFGLAFTGSRAGTHFHVPSNYKTLSAINNRRRRCSKQLTRTSVAKRSGTPKIIIRSSWSIWRII